MRLFLSEYICGGALAEAELPPSLAREGRSMRDAVTADLSRLPGVQVVVTCDARLPAPPDAETIFVTSASQEQRLFEQLCRECDAVYVIAPELDGILIRRCHSAALLNARPLNCDVAAIELCSDKFALWRRLEAARVPTLATQLLPSADNPFTRITHTSECSHGVVVKPRHGAGSQSMRLCRTAEEFAAHGDLFDAADPLRQAIVQPYVPGRPLSIAALFDDNGRLSQLCPPAEQHLTSDGAFQYRGGAVPADLDRPDRLAERVHEAAACVPGLRGYVGFDLLECDDSIGREYRLVEINPRLTTSYIGYRRLTTDNLAADIARPGSLAPISWGAGTVVFQCDGVVLPMIEETNPDITPRTFHEV